MRGGVHDVNERFALGGHLKTAFFHEFIEAFDEVDL